MEYVFILLKNIGFYMEPDVRVVIISKTKKTLTNYIKDHKLEHGYYFIKKKKLFD